MNIENKKPKLKVIRSVEGRGENVIKLLESIGGKNKFRLECDCSNWYYYIDVDGIIKFTVSSCLDNYELEIIELPKELK